jgi:glycosyltransferase involved in cell wall biosynthesis
MTAPWLSVVMPARGGADYLPGALDSVLAQRPHGIELLIYDSSPDTACRAVVERYRDRLPIRYVALPDAHGWPDKTNMAVREAAADHIAMLHVDDAWLPGHLDAVARGIAAAPDAVMHVAPARLIDARGRDIGQWSIPFAPGLWTSEDFGRRLIVQNFIAVPTPVIRRDAWLATGGIDEALWYTGDWDFYLKLAALGTVAVRAEATSAFRLHGSSLTMTGSRNSADMRDQLDIVLERHGARFGLPDERRLRARAQTSIAINCDLAEAARGNGAALARAAGRLFGLGPVDAWLYLRDSRLIERLAPRLRLRAGGAL